MLAGVETCQNVCEERNIWVCLRTSHHCQLGVSDARAIRRTSTRAPVTARRFCERWSVRVRKEVDNDPTTAWDAERRARFESARENERMRSVESSWRATEIREDSGLNGIDLKSGLCDISSAGCLCWPAAAACTPQWRARVARAAALRPRASPWAPCDPVRICDAPLPPGRAKRHSDARESRCLLPPRPPPHRRPLQCSPPTARHKENGKH